MKVFISPLDWGLGHAARLIPIIKKLIDNGDDIIVAGDGNSFLLLKKYFNNNVSFVPFYSLHFKYSKNGINIFNYFILAFQIIWQTIYENHKLRKLIKKYNIDLIISDNRYGLYNKNVTSYLITHQLNVILPQSLFFANSLIKSYLKHYFKKFDKIFIPDYQDLNQCLAGNLSHSTMSNNLNIEYIGPLSRFQNLNIAINEKQYDILLLVSAPSPYCTKIAQTINNIAMLNLSRSFAMVSPYHYNSNCPNLTFYTSPDDIQWISIISKAKNIISTAGYSTIMDLIAIKTSAILVPVKGQTEQEYLADYLDGKYGFTKADTFINAIFQIL
jgi:uncharacterized protein (TIGR00661 family)